VLFRVGSSCLIGFAFFYVHDVAPEERYVAISSHIRLTKMTRSPINYAGSTSEQVYGRVAKPNVGVRRLQPWNVFYDDADTSTVLLSIPLNSLSSQLTVFSVQYKSGSPQSSRRNQSNPYLLSCVVSLPDLVTSRPSS